MIDFSITGKLVPWTGFSIDGKWQKIKVACLL